MTLPIPKGVLIRFDHQGRKPTDRSFEIKVAADAPIAEPAPAHTDEAARAAEDHEREVAEAGARQARHQRERFRLGIHRHDMSADISGED